LAHCCAILADRPDADRHFLGTTLAIKHINLRGAVLGREIDILTYDPGSDPATNGPPPARYPAAGRRC
jgi:hypothetical protein